MSITKRTGDTGNTTLFSGDIVRKDHPVTEALGACEELTCRLGMAKLLNTRFYEPIDRIQHSLVLMAGMLSNLGKGDYPEIDEDVYFLDRMVEEYGRLGGDELRENVIPAGNMASGMLHMARVACREFERRIVSLQDLFTFDIKIIKYINRLSDVLYLMALMAERDTNTYINMKRFD